MIYITGDTHGEQVRFTERKWFDRILTADDTLIICGDFGFLFRANAAEQDFLQYLSGKPYRILFVDGNHENFDALEALPVQTWNGGKVHVLGRDGSDAPKVIHLMRGQVFTMEGKTLFTFGGGYSIDKAYRTPRVSWWPQEMPTQTQMDEGLRNLEAHGNQVDFILTHAAPEQTMSRIFPHHNAEKPLNEYLELIRQKVTYRHWYFGHLHIDGDEGLLWRNQTAMWYSLYTLEGKQIYSGKSLRCTN